MPTFSSPQELVAAMLAVLAPLAPYLQTAAQGAAKMAGEDAWRKARALYDAIRKRFHKDENDQASQTLQLFLANPPTFESALSAFLLQAVQAHPQWADEVRSLLAEPSLQEIVARNQSVLERVTQSLSGPGVQRIEADDSILRDVRQEKKG